MPQGKFERKKFENFSFWSLNWNFLFLNFEKKMWPYHRRKWKNWTKNSILKFEKKRKIQFWNLKKRPYHRREMKNNWNMAQKYEKFHFSKLKWKFMFEIWKKMAIPPEGNETNLKWRNHIFRLCHQDKTSNNTHIPLMYTTLYHKCRLWWYTINLSRQFFHTGTFPTVV
jgi:hypothetical protein